MHPFLKSPLRHLGLDDCRKVPESFCNWFDPALGNWPGLKILSLERLKTASGPGDDIWDEEDPDDRDDDNDDVYWRSRTRIALEDFCDKRGIQFASEWFWFSGYG